MQRLAVTPLEAIPELKTFVLNALVSIESRRVYGRGLDRFLGWLATEEVSTGFSKATVHAFRASLIASGLSNSTVNLYMTAIRRLAVEAADHGLLSNEAAHAIGRVKGMRREGVRTGNWLDAPQAEELISAPNAATLKGKRDVALLAVLVSCGLRRKEAAFLTVDHIQKREGRWLIVDINGKGRRIRSVPMPAWTKFAIDDWIQAAGFQTGRVFRPVNRADRLSGLQMSPQSVFVAVKKYAEQLGVDVAPHDLRRTFARLSHKGKAPIEQIQLSLGHRNLSTTQRYVGVDQDILDAPCDHLGLKDSRRAHNSGTTPL
jgi:integrase